MRAGQVPWITTGTGKSHFTEALAHKAIDAGMRVAWFTLESLTAALARAAVDGTTAKTIAKITRCDLVAIDDIGMLPAGQSAAEALYRLVDAPTSAGPRSSPPTCTPADSTRSCPRPWPPRPSTGCCTTPTSSSPRAPASGSPRPPQERE